MGTNFKYIYPRAYVDITADTYMEQLSFSIHYVGCAETAFRFAKLRENRGPGSAALGFLGLAIGLHLLGVLLQVG